MSSGEPDFIISTVLDVLVELTDWNPEVIWPEHSLGKDLDMTEAQINEFFQRLSHKFPTGDLVGRGNCGGLTLREIVDRIRNQLLAAG